MTPLLFIPGLMCDVRLFEHQISHLSRSRSVMFGALIGFNSISALAKELLVHAPPRFALCGLSMGGIVAMEIARLAPNRVERLALMDTNYRADTPKAQTIRNTQIDQVRQGNLEKVMREDLKPYYVAEGENRLVALDLCMDMATGLGGTVFIDQATALMNRRDQADTLKRLIIPTSIICGAQDRLCPVERHEEMADMVEGSTLHIIQGVGHLPPLETPEITTELLEQWLRQ